MSDHGFSAEMGARAARTIRNAILHSLAMPDISKVHWWGGFLATLAAFCHNDIGAEAHSILEGVNAEALKALTKGTPH